MLPVTDAFRARLIEATREHGSKKPLAKAINASPTTITRLTQPPSKSGHRFSEYVKPICDYFGWSYPHLAESELLEEWHALPEKLSEEAIRHILGLAKALAANQNEEE